MTQIRKEPGNVTVISALEKMDATTLQRAARILSRRLEEGVGMSMKEYLSGPRPDKLDVVTRRLRQSVEKSVTVLPDKVTGTLGNNMPYAGFHEFGFIGRMQVLEHTRVRKELNAKGKVVDTRRAIRDRAGNIVGYGSRKAETYKVESKVKAHERRVYYTGRPFLRPVLARIQPLLLADLRELFKPNEGKTA